MTLLVAGIAIGMVLALLLISPERGVRRWLRLYWARLASLVLGAGAIAGLTVENLPMALVCSVALTAMVFRGYDHEQEEIEEITTEEEKIVPSEKIEIDLSKASKRMVNGKLVIEDD